jgi:hypothetical protein
MSLPFPSNPYPSQYGLLVDEQTSILQAFANAEAQLSITTTSAPVNFLEIYFDGTNILRRSDGQLVTSLSQAEQYRLYKQLGGLFNASNRLTLYP